MRKISKIAALSQTDQEHVLRLCENNRYEDVVPILARSRAEGGLDLKTSRSALCRFVSTFHPEPDRLAHEIKRLTPLLKATSVDRTVVPSAIRTLLEQHIFSELAANKSLQSLKLPLRLLLKLSRQQKPKPPLPGETFHLISSDFTKNGRNSAFPANSAQKNFS